MWASVLKPLEYVPCILIHLMSLYKERIKSRMEANGTRKKMTEIM
jgi:hypothetical protein